MMLSLSVSSSRAMGKIKRMLIIGVALLLLGLFLGIHILFVLGIIGVILGAILFAVGSTGRPIAGRRVWY